MRLEPLIVRQSKGPGSTGPPVIALQRDTDRTIATFGKSTMSWDDQWAYARRLVDGYNKIEEANQALKRIAALENLLVDPNADHERIARMAVKRAKECLV